MRILIVVLALWLPAYAHAEKLVFATTEFPPFIIQQGTELTGVDVDVLHELCKRVGVEVEIRTMPWTRALAYVKGGQVDGIIMPVYSKER
ncbi:MAG: transporter substrate-binding domain-containing protein, partial [Burkholderiales bacterium]|nr:transporter substrate-binding domain-containing protein [Burkholderiales bacterium]